MKHDASDDESEEDNVEGDYTVYECPGLAPVRFFFFLLNFLRQLCNWLIHQLSFGLLLSTTVQFLAPILSVLSVENAIRFMDISHGCCM